MVCSARKTKFSMACECSCCNGYILSGYAVKTRNKRNVSDFVVCEDCYKDKYKEECGWVKYVVKCFNTVTELLVALIVPLMMLVTGMYMLNSESEVKDISVLEVRRIEFAQVRDFELNTDGIKEKFVKIKDRIERVVKHGEYDKQNYD